MKRPLVFSLVREQSMFMTAIMSLMTFLAVLSFGVALSIGTAVVRWNSQWDLFATVQVMNSDNTGAVKKIIDDNKDKIDSVTEISTEQMTDLMAPWVAGNNATLEKYLPKMYEVKFKTASDLDAVGEQISKSARFLTHADALQNSTSAGWKLILIAGLILAMAIGAIATCISYIARNTALLHRRELEILNQIGAADSFVARQMQFIVGKISLVSGFAGFIVAAFVLMLIMSAAHSARVGLISLMTISGLGWGILAATPIAITIFAIWITRRTTLNILKNS